MMVGWPGIELALDPALGRLERAYVRMLGVPINGLRIRLRHVLPMTRGSFRSILDAGCGRGVFTMELAKQHPTAEVVGIDAEPELVSRANEIARKAGLKNCRFEVQDVTRLPYHEEFDLVVSVDNLEHVQDDVGALSKLRDSLKPSGTLVLHVPGYYRRWLMFGKRVNFDVPGHVRPGYTAEEICSRARTAGFDVLEHRYTYGMLETFTNNVSYLITGADQANKRLYALVFPFLLGVSYLGKFSRPRWGAGVLAKCLRPA